MTASATAPARPGDAPHATAADLTLSPAVRRSLRRVQHAYGAPGAHGEGHDRDGGSLPDARLAASARLAAADARRRGLTATRMLVALKAGWWALEEVRRLAMVEARGPAELLERLVTLAIRAYYADDAGPGPVAGVAA
jgi:hypothetical protein